MTKSKNKKLNLVKDVLASEGFSQEVVLKTYNNFANSIEFKGVKKRDRLLIESLCRLLQTRTSGMIVFDLFGNVRDGYKLFFIEGDYIVF